MKYYIVGNGSYSKMLYRYLRSTSDIEVKGFTVAEEFIKQNIIEGLPVVSTNDLSEGDDLSEVRLLMGIGYRNMNKIKEREYNRYKTKGFSFDNYIHPTAIIEKNVVIGEANNIFEGVIIQEGVKIGNGNLIYGGSLIAHESVIGDFNSVSVKSCIAGCTIIGNNCFIGANSTVRDHLTIADYTLVGAGTYVASDTDEYNVVVTDKGRILEGKRSIDYI